MNETFQLSDLDRRILSALQRDASLGMAELAKAVNSSTATCWRRIRALEDAGVIGPPVRHVDPRAVGRGLHIFCQIRMTSQDAKARAEFQRAMEVEQTILEVYAISGEWDYLLHVVARDITDVEAILMRCVLDHPNVANTSTIFALRQVKHTTVIPL